MSFTHKVTCERCNGSGVEPVFPSLTGEPELDPPTVCSGCMGQCHVSRNPDPQPARFDNVD